MQVGDQVLAYDPTTGTTHPQTVQHVWINHDTDLLDLHLQTRVQLDPSVTRRLARAPLEGEPAGRAPPPTTADDAQSGTKRAASGTNGTGTLVRVTDEVVHTTANHPWLTADRGWMEAGQLRPGEPLVTLAGVAGAGGTAGRTATAATTMQAVVLGAVVVPGAAPMWDLSLAQVHTFGVGAGQWVVHNCDTVGYHATQPDRVDSIMENGLHPSSDGRLGPGVYVSDTPEGAVAEFKHYHPNDEPAVLEVKYNAGRNGDLRPLQESGAVIPSYDEGGWLAQYSKYDTLTYYSQRPGGTVNTVIRNGSARVIRRWLG